MLVLDINLAIAYLISYFSRYFSKPLSNKAPYTKPNLLFFIIVMTSMILVSGLRNGIGDTGFYMIAYNQGIYNFTDIFKSNQAYGFYIFQSFLHLISNDPQILVFASALLTNVLILPVLRRYSRYFEISIYVYITFGMFLTSMNGIRQFLAASICFTATHFIINGKFVKYLIVVIVAATVHASALILIPVYFIVRRRAWTKMTFLLLFLGILIVLGFSTFSSALFSSLSDTHYGQYATFDGKGTNVFRILVYAAPLVVAFFGREKLRELWPNSDYIVNLSVVCLLFSIVSLKDWIFDRLNIYFGLYEIILISWLVVLFTKRSQKVVYFLILGLYLFFFYYEEYHQLHLIYTSNYINLN
jgi:transmembrane protein EpsG